MIPVVMLIIGDAQGNHKLAGMYGKFFGTSRVNHSCSCRWKDTDNPHIQCTFVKQSTIKTLCEKGLDEELKNISQHNIINAFDSISVGSHEAGINAMMPSEILHQLFLGVFQYVVEEFFQLFPPMALSRIDDVGVILHHFGKHNSDRSLPSFSSRNGFTTITKKSGTDIIGTGLLCFLVLSMEIRKSILRSCTYGPTDRILKKYQILFQDLLIYSEWLCANKYDKNLLHLCHLKIQRLMISIKFLVKRSEFQNSLKLSKFHEMLHVCRDIRLFGPPEGYDGRPGESAHKFTKTSARKTQRRNNVFEKQTSERLYESIVIDSFYSQRVNIGNPNIDLVNPNRKKTNELNGRRSQYYIFLSEDTTVDSSLVKLGWTDHQIRKHAEVCQFVFNHLNFERKIRIPCKTLLKIELGNANRNCRKDEKDESRILIFHSNPFMNGQEWYDWAWIRWYNDEGDEFEVPAQILCIIDFRDIDIREDELFEKGLSKTMYACIRSLKEPPKVLFNESKISYHSAFEDIHETYRLVDVETITNSCYAIPNIQNFDSVDYDEWILLENRYIWSHHFI